MADFTDPFWSFYVAAITLVSIVACGLLLMSLSRRRVATKTYTPPPPAPVYDADHWGPPQF